MPKFVSFLNFFLSLFQMNPQHNIPTMKDGDFCINESRVIATYLINKHAKDDKLYPKDTVTRAIVDHRYVQQRAKQTDFWPP